MTPLTDRLRAAIGADRALDAEIENLLAGGSDADLAYILQAGVEIATKPPRYTASVDAALTLVPEGWSWSVATTENRQHPVVDLGRSYPTNARVTMEAATPAIAICIAALAAREKS